MPLYAMLIVEDDEEGAPIEGMAHPAKRPNNLL